MWFWWFMFVCDLLIPLILMIAGRMMWKHCPKKINDIYGYRTRRSKRNMETWKFAHNYCGILWWKWGWILLIISSVAHFPFIHSDEDTIGILGTVLCAIQIVILFGTIFMTERTLKKEFPDGR